MTLRSIAVVSLVHAAGCGQVGSGADASVDSPDDTGVDGGVMAAPPDAIFKYLSWFDADEPNTLGINGNGNVTFWKNRSGYGEALPRPVDASNGITIEETAANGHRAVRVGAMRGILNTTGGFPPCPYLIAVVAAYANPASEPATFLHADTPFSDLSFQGNWWGQGAPRSVVFAGSPSSGHYVTSERDGWNDGNLHVFGFRADAAGLAVRVDGDETTRATICERSNGSLDIGGAYYFDGGTIGDDSGADFLDGGRIGSVLEGYIAEIVFAGDTSGTPFEIAQLSAYFQKKYGLPF